MPHSLFEQTDSGFVDVALDSGTSGIDDYGWGGCAVDVDGDAREDLMVATLNWPSESPVDNRLYLALDSGLAFQEDDTGWPNEQFPLYHLGRFDLDGDRAPDIIGHGAIPIAQLLLNTNEQGASRMTVRLVGTTSNSHAVGALIEVYAAGQRQMQQVDAGSDYVTQHSYTRFFGMDTLQTLDSIVVTWPGANTETWYALDADTAHVLVQGPDINGDGLVGVSDVLAMLNVFGTPCLAVPEVPEVMEAATYAVDVESGIVYAEGLSHDTLNSATATAMPLLLDAYVPENAGPNRPAMVLIHGGGFFGGSRTALSMVNLAQYFASRGWVVFSIDYRLASDMGTVPQAWVDSLSGLSVELGSLNQSLAIYPAHRDAKAALRWVVSHAEDYEINTDYLTVGGGSAGAITSIGVGVTESEDFTEELTVDEDPTLLTTHLGVDFEVQTILDFWGSRISVSILEGSYGVERFDPSDPPLCIFHGTEDPTVLYFNALVLQATYENTGVPYVLHTLEGAGHGPWGANIDGVGLPALAFNFMVAQQALTVQ